MPPARSDADILRREHGAPGTHPVGQHRHREAQRHEPGAPPPAAKADIRDERAERHHRDQELDPRTGFRDLEQAGGGIDEHAVDRRRDAGQVHQADGQAGGDRLHRRDQFLAERDEQQHVAQRKREPGPDARPHHREHGGDQGSHRAQLPRQRQPGKCAQHPQQGRAARIASPGHQCPGAILASSPLR